MNRIGNKWTDQEENQLLEGIQKGHSMEDLSQRHQRTVKAIEMRVEYMIKKASKTMLPPQLASHFHLPEPKIKQILQSASPMNSSGPGVTLQQIEQQIKTVLDRLDRIDHIQEKIYKKIKTNLK